MPSSSPPLDEQLVLPEVLDMLPVPVIVLDRSGSVRAMNEAAEEISGIERVRATGRPIWEVVREEDRPGARDAVEALLSRGPGSAQDVPAPWLEGAEPGPGAASPWRASTAHDPRGAVHAVVLGRADRIPRSRRMHGGRPGGSRDEALHATTRSSGIVEMASDAIVSIDESQRITLFNRGAEAIFGWKAEEVLGEPLSILLPERFRHPHGEHVRDFAASSVQARPMAERRAIRGLRRDGEEFPAEASIVKTEVGGETVLSVVLRDTSSRQRAQAHQRFLVEVGELLAGSLDLDTTLASIADRSLDFLADCCVVDLVEDDGSVRRVVVSGGEAVDPEAVRELREVSLDRERPHLMWTSLSTGTSELVSEVTEETLRTIAQGSAHLEILRTLGLASYMTVPLQARERTVGALLLMGARHRRPYDEEDLELARELGVLAGLAVDNARLYSHAQRAIRARDELLALVSHDLGNPLQAVFVGLDALERRVEGGSGDPYLSGIRRSAESMERLIRELLQVRRMEEGHLAPALTSVHLPALVHEVLALIEPLARVKSVALETDVPEDLPSARADRDRILQVLSNIVGNAVKHTPAGGQVRVHGARDRGRVRISVADTGPGIPSEHRERVFERFWRGEKGSDRPGIGLGLAIARGIVQAHGGRIWVDGEREGGSTFHFTLPVAPPS